MISALPFFWIQTPVAYLRFYLWSPAFAAFIPTLGRRWSAYRERERDHQTPDTRHQTPDAEKPT